MVKFELPAHDAHDIPTDAHRDTDHDGMLLYSCRRQARYVQAKIMRHSHDRLSRPCTSLQLSQNIVHALTVPAFKHGRRPIQTVASLCSLARRSPREREQPPSTLFVKLAARVRTGRAVLRASSLAVTARGSLHDPWPCSTHPQSAWARPAALPSAS